MTRTEAIDYLEALALPATHGMSDLRGKAERAIALLRAEGSQEESLTDEQTAALLRAWGLPRLEHEYDLYRSANAEQLAETLPTFEAWLLRDRAAWHGAEEQ